MLERQFRHHRGIVLHAMGGMGKTTLATEAADWWTRSGLFRDGACFESFRQRHRLSRDMLWAAVCLRDCRTAEMGSHRIDCPRGHESRLAYNSCRHRVCPKCSAVPREVWLDGWRTRLLHCPHFHVVFTTPHDLLPLWRYNRRRFANALFAAASGALMKLLGDEKYLGARPGLLNRLGRTTWNVKILERYDHGVGVATYLARYLKGGPISNRRLLKFEREGVRFRGRARREDTSATSTTHLATDDFLLRLLQHVPPRGLRVVRGFGLYAGGQREWLNAARQLLGQVPLPAEPSQPPSWQAICERAGGQGWGRCQECGATLLVSHFPPNGRPPPVLPQTNKRLPC